jgi:GNAT superfamily N-acetyltransferase
MTRKSISVEEKDTEVVGAYNTREDELAPKFHIRLATIADVLVLQTLIDASVRGLQTQDYTPAQIEGAMETAFGIDSQLLEDGTYFVVENVSPAVLATIVGCGGWSNRKTLCGSDHAPDRDNALLDPQTEAAKIRAFFVHPDWARRGIGSFLLTACEDAAKAAGFTRFEMGATLTGVPLYQAKNYVETERFAIPLKNGEALPIVRMRKSI